MVIQGQMFENVGNASAIGLEVFLRDMSRSKVKVKVIQSQMSRNVGNHSPRFKSVYCRSYAVDVNKVVTVLGMSWAIYECVCAWSMRHYHWFAAELTF